MEGQTSSSRGRLWLVSSPPEPAGSTSADPTEARVLVAEPDREPAGVLRRRYTVTVQADGSELVDEIEEWEE